jgi:hypothetical protein
MRKVIHKRVYGINRKKVFELDNLRLWLGTRERPEGEPCLATLQLEHRQPVGRSKWEVCWSGLVRTDPKWAEVENIELAGSK